MIDRLDSLFCAAVSAVDAGDIAELNRLLAQEPALVRERLRSPGPWLRDVVGKALDGFFNAPYLLWFVAEDPVRNGTLPRNIAEIARAIIDAAAAARAYWKASTRSLRERIAVLLDAVRESPPAGGDGGGVQEPHV